MKRTASRQPSLPQREGVFPSHLDFAVVGIGASAGGLNAVRTFFEHMPANSGMAFVVVLHLSPDHESVADQILQGCTSMLVHQVTDTSLIEPNHVYYGSVQPKGQSQQACFTRRLTKPVQYDELVDTIEAVCKHAGT